MVAYVSFKYGDSIVVKINKVILRSIVEAMALEIPDDEDWKGRLDSAHGIKYLRIEELKADEAGYDFGSVFFKAIQYIRKNGPPDYYPKEDMQLLEKQLNILEFAYMQIRGKGAVE